ncbi:MAG TPA: ATP-binding protein [Candidatus Baltobacteraceae bacterium]|nr:ATP-binding protein [Candidatus Baltobacteraceae bacterium]
MSFLFYVRLIALTAGTLVYLFLIALILGHRRPRLFERLLFFLALALLAIYGGGLLEINAEIQYSVPPAATRFLYSTLTALGVLFAVPFVVQTHLEYLRQVRAAVVRRWAVALAYSLYLLPAFMLVYVSVETRTHPTWGTEGFLAAVVRQEGLIVFLAALIAAAFQWRLARSAPNVTERGLFRWLCAASALVAVAVLFLGPASGIPPEVSPAIAGVLPGAVLIRYSLRRNFLDFGAQRNLVYALSATVLALLYLALVHRISGWLAPVFPPEATASVLLFVLVFLFEPLERLIGPALHRTFRERVDRWQRLAVELQEEARHGDVAQLLAGAERRIRDEFSLAAVRISVPRDPALAPLESPGGLGHVARIPLKKGREEIGVLEAATTGSYLTGETTAALEFLAEQLPAMIDLCRLIEEKIRLERQLAERERLAMLGQMAASVSHNLRNPLGAMKTVLQVQLENPNLPVDVRQDCLLVLSEVDRMGAKLTQLLHFAKPSADRRALRAADVAHQVVALFRQDAERRGVKIELHAPGDGVSLHASEEALNEILSNLVVNAIEAQPEGGRVRLRLATAGDRLDILVEDDGPGISPEARTKMFQPFFTTKATGTGLGLAIVARRISEMGGTIACESPLAGGRGTRMRISLPLAEGAEAASVASAAERTDPSLRLAPAQPAGKSRRRDSTQDDAAPELEK